MIDRDPYDRTERFVFFVALGASILMVPAYFFLAHAYDRQVDGLAALPTPTEAFFRSGWLAGLLITSVPLSLGASLACARRSKRLAFGVLALVLAIATPVIGWWAARLPFSMIVGEIR